MFFVAIAVAATVAASPTPTMCMEGECKSVHGDKVVVAPAEHVRPFAWLTADRRRVFAGILARSASIVQPPTEAAVTQKFSVKMSDTSAAGVSFDLRCGEKRWTWTFAILPSRPVVLGRPAGECTLSAEAAGYKKAEVGLTTADAILYLHRLPSVSIRVSDATTHLPIAGAYVYDAGSELLGSTDESGRLSAVIDGRWPEALRVEAVGKAPRRISMPKAVADAEIAVALSAGGSVAVSLPEVFSKHQLEWEIRSQPGELVRKGRVPSGQTEITIEVIEAGRYVFVLLGEGPLQRIGTPIVVREGEISAATVTRESALLAVEVRLGDRPLDGAQVEMTFENGLWRASVKTDEEGRAVEEIWQHGDYAAVVTHVPLVRFWREKRRLDDDSIDWTITVANRRVHGQIKDERTGAAIADANIRFRAVTTSGAAAVLVGRSSADGAYEFNAVPSGTFQMSVSKKGYVPVETQRFSLPESVSVETRDISMRQTAGRSVTVADARRMPLANAVVYVASQNGTRLAGATDDGGRLELPVSSHESGYVFAIPQSGSLGMTRLVPLLEADSPEITIRVADGVSSLELRAESTSGDPIPGLSLLIRIDGVLLPPPVREGLAQYLGIPLTTDSNGRLLFPHLPPGRFEAWPLASRADYDAVRSAAPPPAPVNITLTPGHHTARLKFEPKD